MATVVCPSCGRYNIAKELAMRGFTCETCGRTLPIPEELPKEDFSPPQTLRRAEPVMRSHAQPGTRNYPISRVCPNCGHAEYKSRRPERFVAFTWDRVCKACETRYTPPTPIWAAVIFLLIGFLLAGFGFFSVLIRIIRGNVLGIPAMACEGFLGVFGILAIVQGLRAFIRPGKA